MHEKETDDKVVDVSGKHEKWLHVFSLCRHLMLFRSRPPACVIDPSMHPSPDCSPSILFLFLLPSDSLVELYRHAIHTTSNITSFDRLHHTP